MKKYFFKSDRLGFRNWEKTDLNALSELNADPDVMAHFPKTLSEDESKTFIKRLQNHYTENGHSYFAVEIIESGEFIGFIGLARQNYDIDFTPAVDIGWRLKKSAWGLGYATEGAKRCLMFAFEELKLKNVIATCPKINENSEKVMKKIGMEFVKEFEHPLLLENDRLKTCLLYNINNSN